MTLGMIESRHLIANEWVDSETTDRQEVINPATGELIATTGIAETAMVDRAVSAARAAVPGWSATTPGERGEVLLALAAELDRNVEDLGRLEALNVGKPLSKARREVERSADVLRFYAGAGRVLPGAASAEYAAGMTSVLRREPIGVAALITPWNYPLVEAVWKIAPALAAGNTCVLKPSELTPLTTLALGALAAGVLPRGVLNIVTGTGQLTGSALVEHPEVDMVALTGDVATGMQVAAAGARTLKRIHLELGGKAPVVVAHDADIKRVAQALRVASFENAGQVCTAACRVVAHDEVYEPLIDALTSAAGDLAVGDSLAGEPAEIGPLISQRQRARVLGFVERARAAGATVLCGGGELDRPGFFMTPTVVADVAQDSEIVQREVFGPVVTVQRGSSLQQLLAMANDVQYGLAASIWTEDLRSAHLASRTLNFGTVWVNQHGPSVAEMPFGGFGYSGYGKQLSIAAIEEYTRTKHILTAVGEQ